MNDMMYAKERIYALDANGDPAFLIYAEGDEIVPEDAARLGIKDGRQPRPHGLAKRVNPDAIENKAVKPAAKSKTPPKE